MKIISFLLMFLSAFVIGQSIGAAVDFSPVVTGIVSSGTSTIMYLSGQFHGILAVNYADLDYLRNKPNIPGIKAYVYFAPKADILTWPTLAAAPASLADLGQYAAGNIVMKTGKQFFKIGTVSQKGKADSETQGEAGSQSFVNKLTFQASSLEPAYVGFASKAIYDDLVYIVVDAFTGVKRMMGNEEFETVTKVTATTGDSPTSSKGLTVTAEVPDIAPLLIYQGEIPLSPAV